MTFIMNLKRFVKVVLVLFFILETSSAFSTFSCVQFFSNLNLGHKNVKDKILGDKLHEAVRNGSLRKALNLLQKGVDINVKDKEGHTPLQNAVLAENSDPKIVSFLLANSADIHIKDEDRNILQIAILTRNPKIVSLFLEKEADVYVNVKDKEGHTPLQNAIFIRNPEIVLLLLEKGADIHVQDENGHTPLYKAFFVRDPKIASLLLKYGANLKDIDSALRASFFLTTRMGEEYDL